MTPLEPFDVITPLGPAVCIGVVADIPIPEWVTFIKSTGEPWFWRNHSIRLDPQVTSGHPSPSPFGPPSATLSKHLARYKAHGWLAEDHDGTD
jgi:hypothetical protein